MKTIVIYKSATGFTKKYAQWIAEELSADIFSVKDIKLQKMLDYDCIVFGSRLFAGTIDGISLVTKNLEKLKDKRLIVFATGASSMEDDSIQEVKEKCLSSELKDRIEFFYLRGGFDYSKLKTMDRIMMNAVKRMILKKHKNGETLTSDDAGMLAIFDNPVDFTDKKYIHDILQAVRA